MKKKGSESATPDSFKKCEECKSLEEFFIFLEDGEKTGECKEKR